MTHTLYTTSAYKQAVEDILDMSKHIQCISTVDDDGDENCIIVRTDQKTPVNDLYPNMYTAYLCVVGNEPEGWMCDDDWLAVHLEENDDSADLHEMPLRLVLFALREYLEHPAH